MGYTVKMLFSATHGTYIAVHPIHGRCFLNFTGRKTASTAGKKEAERVLYGKTGAVPGSITFNWV